MISIQQLAAAIVRGKSQHGGIMPDCVFAPKAQIEAWGKEASGMLTGCPADPNLEIGTFQVLGVEILEDTSPTKMTFLSWIAPLEKGVVQ